MRAHLRSANSLLAVCGMVAPVLFALAVIVFGFLREDYSHMEQEISELGAIGSPNMAGMNASIILTGLLISAFSLGLYHGIGPGKKVMVGSLLVFVVGLGTAVVGVFPTDISCPSPTCNSIANNGHAIGVLMVFSSIPFAVLLFSRGLRGDMAWRPYRTYSLVTGIALLALLVLLFAFNPDADNSPLQPWSGAIQRLFLASWLLWIEIMAIRLYVYAPPLVPPR